MLLILETKPADIQTVLPENEELTCNPIVTTNSAEEHCLSDMPLQTEGSNAGMFYIQPRAAVSSISSEPSTSNPNSSNAYPSRGVRGGGGGVRSNPPFE